MTLTSLKQLGDAFNLPTVEAKPERVRKCKICGSDMEHISGTNVWACHGTLTVPDTESKQEGATKEVPCTNIIMGRI